MNIFLEYLSKAINAYLDLDPDSKQRINALQGKIIAVEFLPLHFSFLCEFDENQIIVKSDSSGSTNAKISGTPLQMFGVMMTKENRQRFFADDLTIEGDAEFAQQVIELFDRLHIDWEEYLSHFMGDIPAYHVSNTLKKFTSWLDGAKESWFGNINEYIHEESQWLPAREALEDFFIEIDTLRMDLDRAEAKIKHIQLQMEEVK